MRYVLDTNVVAALMRGDEKVVARLERTSRALVSVPEPAWAEIAYGIARLPHSRKRERLVSRLGFLRGELATAEWTSSVSDAFGELKAGLERRGLRIEDFDVAMAAHALAEGAILVTSNLKHLGRIREIEVEEWSSTV